MTSALLRGTPIVCVGFAEWDAELRTNQHHLMTLLARASPVLYVESLGLRRPTATARDLRRMARRLVRGLRPIGRANDVAVLSPLVVPYHGTRLVQRLNDKLLRLAVRRAARKLALADPVLWSYVPQGRALLRTLEPRLVVYHCVDDIGAHERVDTASFRRAEEAFTREADLVLASSRPLYERLSGHSTNIRLMPNVADTEAFATALLPGPVDPMLRELPRPRLVFAGAISGVKVDLELVLELARLRPSWSVLLIGPVGLGDPETDVTALRAEPNVHLLGPRKHEDLPQVFRGADAGIIPYRLNQLTASVFPMKVYEYLAAGLPTVTTRLPALSDVADISFASGAAEMCDELERLLAEDSGARRRERSALAQEHSWEARLEEIEQAVAETPWRR
jgi:glycosyltransferase involved in cell wall biosynthesis